MELLWVSGWFWLVHLDLGVETGVGGVELKVEMVLRSRK